MLLGELGSCCVWTMKTRAGSGRAQWFYRWAGALTALFVFFLLLTLLLTHSFTYAPISTLFVLASANPWEKQSRPCIQVNRCHRDLILATFWHRQVRQLSKERVCQTLNTKSLLPLPMQQVLQKPCQPVTQAQGHLFAPLQVLVYQARIFSVYAQRTASPSIIAK